MPTLSEIASKQLVAQYGVPVPNERTATTINDAVIAAEAIGYPVVLKICGDAIAHKTERGLVRLALRDAEAVAGAYRELVELVRPDDGVVEILVAPMLRATRELIAGLVRDPQFGPCVMLGVGGVLAEALGDVAFRLAPVSDLDADELLDDLATQALLAPFRGEPAIDRIALQRIIEGLGRLARDRPDVASVDLNPLLIVDGTPIAVDALVELAAPAAPPIAPRARPTNDKVRALFEPRGIVVAGASTHPGKFGFVALHNILAAGYEGAIAATNLEGTSVLGVETVASI
ncbi:MAG TPA: acetate--CoA ligase family protein, partial [Acidimicrobiia bacterium]|nr:acetate--CoA ligase family protein [Acidimicrobiia bacterium]